MGKCVIYLQLFVGWLILNVCTFAMTLVPHSPRFLEVAPNILESERFVVFGLWVLVEIALFFLLLVTATIILCSCKDVPAGAGFVHMLVDPALVTLGCSPFIIIRGLPKVVKLQACVSGLEEGINKTAFAKKALACLTFNPHTYMNGSSHIASNGGHHQFTGKDVPYIVTQWTTILQGAILLPVILRVVHFRWKMSWQPFIHSNLFLFVQAFDVVMFVETTVYVHKNSLRPFILGAIYISTILLCVGSLTIAIPPVYMGNQLTNKFLKSISYVGIMSVDLPCFILRCSLLNNGKIEEPNGVLLVIMVKEVFFLSSLVCLWLKRASLCVTDTYESLNLPEPEFHEVDDCDQELQEMEEYV